MIRMGKAARELKAFQGMFKEVNEILEVLEDPLKMEREMKIMAGERDKLVRELEEARRMKTAIDNECASAIKRMDQANTAADKKLSDTEGRNKTLVMSAESKSEDILKGAAVLKGKQEEALRDALAQASSIVATSRSESKGIIQMAHSKAAEVDRDTSKANANLVTVRNETAAAERQLAAVKAEIDRLKKAFAS